MAQATKEPARPKAIVPLLPYQLEDVESEARFRWNCWARQTGKSFTKSLRRIIRGLLRGRNQVFLSAGERQSRELMEKARMHCQALKIATEFRQSDYFRGMTCKMLEIRLPGKIRIVGLPANPATARGFTADVFLDEFAMHEHDREIWAAMFPTLLRGEGELDVASTPHGRSNLFYQLMENARFSKSVVTLPEAIAQGLRADEQEIRAAMSDDMLYRQEFLCEFLDEATAFLTLAQIGKCVDPGLIAAGEPGELMQETRDLYVGVDIGRHRDLTVLWVLAAESGQLVTVGVIERAAAPFRDQFDVLCELLSHPRVRRCCIDAGGLGMQLAEDATARFGSHRVEGIQFTAAVKSQLAGQLRIAVEAGRIRIPPDERIRGDWHSVERVVSAGGHFRLAAPRQDGSHADRFWAAALAVHAAGQEAGRAEVLAARTLQFARAGAW